MDTKLLHRFYEQEFPNIGDIVIVIATEMTDMGAYVNLPEYPELNGMIQLGELSQKRVRSYNKVIRIGHVDTAIVSKVDPDKKNVDLSRRRLRPQDTAAAIDKYTHAKTIGLIVRNLALKTIATKYKLTDISKITQFDEVALLQNELYNEFVWPLYSKYGHAYNAFMSMILGEIECFPTSSFSTEQLLEEITTRIKPDPIRVYADIQIICAGINGLRDLRRVINVGLNESIQIHLLAPPLYRLSTESIYQADGAKTILNALDSMKTLLDTIPGAVYNVIKEPTIMDKLENILETAEESELSE